MGLFFFFFFYYAPSRYIFTVCSPSEQPGRFLRSAEGIQTFGLEESGLFLNMLPCGPGSRITQNVSV